MKVKNKELYLYTSILIFSAAQMIYSCNIHMRSENEAIAISLVDMSYMTIGLVYIGIAAMMAFGIWKYHIGKIFSIQLFLTGIALIINYYASDEAWLSVNLLLVASNICLYIVVGRITGLYQGLFFKILGFVYILIVVYQISDGCTDVFAGSYTGKTLLINYIITFFTVIVLLVRNYNKVSKYSKDQIKLLLRSLTIGIVLYCVLSVISIVDISPSYENIFVIEDETNVTESYDDSIPAIATNANSTLPPIAFSVVIFRIFFILIKKEYFVSEVTFWINKTVKHIVLIVVLNLIIALYFSGSLIGTYLINILFMINIVYSGKEYMTVGKSQRENKILEDDRYTLAMYLHDEILQDVFAIRNTSNIDMSAEEKFTVLISKIRNLSNNLFPLIVENVGLDRSLQIYINDLRKSVNIEFNYEYYCTPGSLELRYETALYRIVKELINNAVKHSQATKISIIISNDLNVVRATIVDNGVGFEVPELSELIVQNSMGLYSVYKQSKELEGQFKLYSSKNTGTECTIQLPL